jgi:hypothetical protein
MLMLSYLQRNAPGVCGRVGGRNISECEERVRGKLVGLVYQYACVMCWLQANNKSTKEFLPRTIFPSRNTEIRTCTRTWLATHEDVRFFLATFADEILVSVFI